MLVSSDSRGWLVWCRVSNGTGQCNFSGQRDRSFYIVPGQRDNGTSSKSCHGPGRAGTASQNLGRDAGQDNHCFAVKIRDSTRDGTIIIFFLRFPVLEHFPVLELNFPVLECPFLF
jgi:hypothetical protein